jgi:hypothetical protein
MGRARSLMVASAIGLVATALGLLFMVMRFGADVWLLLIGAFAATQSWAAFKQSRALVRVMALPRHEAFKCPSCRESPPSNLALRCGACGQPFDVFAQSAPVCPNCGTRLAGIPCVFCGVANEPERWAGTVAAPAQSPPIMPPPPGAAAAYPIDR